MNIEESNEVRVKNEPIYDSQSISETREATLRNKRTIEAISSAHQPNKRKKDPIDTEIQTSKSHVELRSEEFELTRPKKSSRKQTEKFAYKRSIQTTSNAFLNKKSDDNKNEPNKSNSK